MTLTPFEMTRHRAVRRGLYPASGRVRPHVEQVLQDFGGILQVDGYTLYNRLIRLHRIGRVSNWRLGVPVPAAS